MRKGIAACAGMIGGLVLLIAGFLGPWYGIHATGILGAEYHTHLFLTRMELQAEGQDIFVSLSYAEAKTNAENMNMNVESFTTIETGLYLSLLAMVTAILTIFFMAAYVLEKGGPTIMKFSGGGFAFLTFLFTLFPALYFMNTEFVKNSGGFWFNLSILGMTITGGPGYAWYLMIVVAVLSLICAVVLFMIKISPADASKEKIAPPATR
jgi:hypothetical protein